MWYIKLVGLLEHYQLPSVTSASDTEDICDEMDKVLKLHDQLMDGKLSAEQVCSGRCLDTFYQKLEKNELVSHRTACLWLQYMKMIDIGLQRQFIKSERTGNFSLILKTLQNMLPFFAASWHNLYTKSVYIHLQQMLKLETEHTDVFAFLNSGYHVVRRSGRYWTGLSTDLVIEQVLMRTIKTTGELTRGRGMEELQRSQWVLSMPACSKFTGSN